jgi:hypothetical protein
MRLNFDGDDDDANDDDDAQPEKKIDITRPLIIDQSPVVQQFFFADKLLHTET